MISMRTTPHTTSMFKRGVGVPKIHRLNNNCSIAMANENHNQQFSIHALNFAITGYFFEPMCWVFNLCAGSKLSEFLFNTFVKSF